MDMDGRTTFCFKHSVKTIYHASNKFLPNCILLKCQFSSLLFD